MQTAISSDEKRPVQGVVICEKCGAYGSLWDFDPASGRSNSSAEFNFLVTEVSRMIRDSAHSLISGNTDSVSRLILARMAHIYGLVPTKSIEEMQAADR